MSKSREQAYADRSAAAILDSLTTPIAELGGVCPVEVNDREAAERLLSAAIHETLRCVRKWYRDGRKS